MVVFRIGILKELEIRETVKDQNRRTAKAGIKKALATINGIVFVFVLSGYDGDSTKYLEVGKWFASVWYFEPQPKPTSLEEVSGEPATGAVNWTQRYREEGRNKIKLFWRRRR